MSNYYVFLRKLIFPFSVGSRLKKFFKAYEGGAEVLDKYGVKLAKVCTKCNQSGSTNYLLRALQHCHNYSSSLG